MARKPNTPLRLEYRDAKELKDNPANWRKHPAKQLDALRDVIAEVGWAGAVLYNERTKRLIDGHARKGLAKGKIPVLIGSWTDEQEKKILATLDPIAALAEADLGALEAVLQGVQTESEAVQDLLKDLAAGELVPFFDPGINDGLCDPDDVPAPPDEAITCPGDLWVVGDHRVLCGDAGKSEDVDRLVDGSAIHLVNTDPPYNVKVEPRSNNAIRVGLSTFPGDELKQKKFLNKTCRANGLKHHQSMDLARHPEKSRPTGRKLRPKDRPLANDFVSDEEFDRLLLAWFGNIARVLLPGRLMFIWGGYSNIANYPHALGASGLYFSQQIIWHKMHPVLSRKCFMGDHEWCFFGWREGAAHQFFGPPNISDVWSVKKINPQSMQHLTEKPTELAVRAIQYGSRVGENVLDLFGGSGSTLIAAEQTGRRCFMMELDPLYCDVILQRWENFTGKKAKRRSTKRRSKQTGSTKTEAEACQP
jgi:DNA modification methylase